MDLLRYEVRVEEYMGRRCREHLQLQQEMLGRPVTFDYRYEHTRTAVHIAGELAEGLGVEPGMARIAAWLHDIAKCWDPNLDQEANRRREANHGPVGAREAARYLDSLGFCPDLIVQVEQAIANHVGFIKDYTLEEPLDALLWDADKLSKISSAGVLHYLGARLSGGEEVLDMVEHFNSLDWNLHQGIRDSLNTDLARAWADEELVATARLQKQILVAMAGDCIIT